MARPAGSAGAQGAATTELARGPIGSGLSRQEPGSVAYGGLHATLEEHEALIALLVRFDSSCVERCSFEALARAPCGHERGQRQPPMHNPH